MENIFSKRQNLILDMLEGQEGLPVTEISTRLALSVVTIRTELRFLETKGLIYRSNGKVYNNLNVPMQFRFKKKLKEKNAIAKKAATLIDDNDSIMICQGSTAALVPTFLTNKIGIKIVTNSFQTLEVCKNTSNFEINFIGGKYYPLLDANVGANAIEQVNNYFVDVLFIGADGVSSDFGVSTAMEENSQLLRKMSQNASKTILLVDSTKIGIKALFKILSLTELSTIVSDSNCPKSFINEANKQGVEVIIAEI
ncbi:MAG: DeoR/GlpR family DNA-binding transcription regulator [Sphaerochaetaceae bacterium]|nr:DeoR/GlpR family DNA-binding transcription regulator [Sphaerochaetaceae bacterium]MDC7236150.1 DeoR/GlpR family DNA-binding transcription regulator [Sphaerochaetaceae bacterium]